jgi:hypothetical protein
MNSRFYPAQMSLPEPRMDSSSGTTASVIRRTTVDS